MHFFCYRMASTSLVCKHCGAEKRNADLLRRHIRERHGETEVCPICETFTTTKSFMYNMRIHIHEKHGVDPDDYFQFVRRRSTKKRPSSMISPRKSRETNRSPPSRRRRSTSPSTSTAVRRPLSDDKLSKNMSKPAAPKCNPQKQASLTTSVPCRKAQNVVPSASSLTDTKQEDEFSLESPCGMKQNISEMSTPLRQSISSIYVDTPPKPCTPKFAHWSSGDSPQSIGIVSPMLRIEECDGNVVITNSPPKVTRVSTRQATLTTASTSTRQRLPHLSPTSLLQGTADISASPQAVTPSSVSTSEVADVANIPGVPILVDAASSPIQQASVKPQLDETSKQIKPNNLEWRLIPLDTQQLRPMTDPRIFFSGAPTQLTHDFPAGKLEKFRMMPSTKLPTTFACYPGYLETVVRTDRAILPDGTIYEVETRWMKEPRNKCFVLQDTQTEEEQDQ